MIVCPCNTINDFPVRCPYHSPDPGPIEPQTYTTTDLKLIPGWVHTAPPLSDDDVDRIADRVVEKLKGAKPKTAKKKAKKI
jgi:hypothetical protein